MNNNLKREIEDFLKKVESEDDQFAEFSEFMRLGIPYHKVMEPDGGKYLLTKFKNGYASFAVHKIYFPYADGCFDMADISKWEACEEQDILKVKQHYENLMNGLLTFAYGS